MNAFAFSLEEPPNLFVTDLRKARPDIKASFSIKGKVSPFDGVKRCIESEENSDYAANLAAKLKDNKYKTTCEARNLKFTSDW